MAVTKTHPIKSTLKAAIDYICNPEKTDGKLLVSSYDERRSDKGFLLQGDPARGGHRVAVLHHPIRLREKRWTGLLMVMDTLWAAVWYLAATPLEHTGRRFSGRWNRPVGAEAAANKSAGILSIISAKVGAAANADFSREGSTIITKAIENTILTDYLDYAAKAGKPYIRIFSDCKPYPYPESFAYFKTLTPYLKMTNGQIEVSDGLSLNLALMDEALDSGRGYYELMAECAGETVVLRFNIKAFRNNYFISDLVKMNLDYHAVEVGTVSIDSLTMQSEFGDKREKEISGFNLIDDDSSTSSDKIKVYDVILAGVCR